MKYVLALILPPVGLLSVGKPFQAFFNMLLCLFVLAVTVVGLTLFGMPVFVLPVFGLPFASLWSVLVVATVEADRRTDRLIHAMNGRGGSSPTTSSLRGPGSRPKPSNAVPAAFGIFSLLCLSCFYLAVMSKDQIIPRAQEETVTTPPPRPVRIAPRERPAPVAPPEPLVEAIPPAPVRPPDPPETVTFEEPELKLADRLAPVRSPEGSQESINRAANLVRMGDNLAKAGKPEAAQHNYRRVVADFPGTPGARQAAERIRAMVDKLP